MASLGYRCILPVNESVHVIKYLRFRIFFYRACLSFNSFLLPHPKWIKKSVTI